MSCQQHSWKNSFTCWSILVNQLKRLLDSKFLRWSLGANQLSCPKYGPTDLTVLTIGSAPSRQWRSGPEAFRAGHYKDLTETGNRARKVSGTQGSLDQKRRYLCLQRYGEGWADTDMFIIVEWKPGIREKWSQVKI